MVQTMDLIHGGGVTARIYIIQQIRPQAIHIQNQGRYNKNTRDSFLFFGSCCYFAALRFARGFVDLRPLPWVTVVRALLARPRVTIPVASSSSDLSSASSKSEAAFSPLAVSASSQTAVMFDNTEVDRRSPGETSVCDEACDVDLLRVWEIESNGVRISDIGL